MDDRLNLIAGGNGSGNDAAAQSISISAFAAQNFFSWRFLDGLALFSPAAPILVEEHPVNQDSGQEPAGS
jgi:hypothetical protein